MRTITKKRILIIIILIFFATIAFPQSGYIYADPSNTSDTRTKCIYTLKGTIYACDFWGLDTTACVVYSSEWKRSPGSTKSSTLRLKWKNVEASASSSLYLTVDYGIGFIDNGYAELSVDSFTLIMPTPSFNAGAPLNIPCYDTSPVTVELSPYINTGPESVGIDQGLTITSHFEWTLPTGWQTTTGQTGTFVSSSFISVIPPVSSSPVSISVKAKANTQYSLPATLQITRNLKNFAVTGPTTVLCNTTHRYTVPSTPGVSYTWQLPNGWGGTSSTNFIDVIASGASGSIICKMTGCNENKPSTPLQVSVNIIDPSTSMSGPALVCSSGATFMLSGLAVGNTVFWEKSWNLAYVSGQGTISYKVKSSGGILPTVAMASSEDLSNMAPMAIESTGSSGWVRATISNSCGDIPLEKTVWAGLPGFIPVVSGYPTVTCGNSLFTEANNRTVTWSVGGPLQIVGSNYGYKCVVRGTERGVGWVYATAANDCGSLRGELLVEVSCGYSLVFSPNPSSGETTIEIATGSGEVLAPDTEWDLEVYDSMQSLKTKTQKLKGDKQTINTSSWKDGVYIVRVKIGKEIISEKLVVKH